MTKEKKDFFLRTSHGVNCKASKDKHALGMRIGRAFLSVLLYVGYSAIPQSVAPIF